jgi:hypothetical protein
MISQSERQISTMTARLASGCSCASRTAIVVNFAATVQHVRLLNRLNRGEIPDSYSGPAITVALILGVLGLAMVLNLYLGAEPTVETVWLFDYVVKVAHPRGRPPGGAAIAKSSQPAALRGLTPTRGTLA